MAAARVARFAFASLAFGGVAEAALPTLSQRQDDGECAMATYQAGTSVFAAGRQLETMPSSAVTSVEVGSASFITSIMYGTNFKVVVGPMAKEQYVLTQCGTAQPTDAEIDAVLALPTGYARKHFTIPLQNVGAPDTTTLGFLAALNVADRVSAISQYASGACWQKSYNCGSAAIDSWSDADGAAAQMNGADAVFMGCSSTTPLDCSNVNGRSNGVHFAATMEETPLRSVEHIKFLAAFFNKEQVAENFMAGKIQAYQNAGVTVATKPVVAWVSYSAASSWSAAQFSVSVAGYKLKMVTDAGGANVDMAAVKTAMGDKMSESYVVAESGYSSKAEAAAAFFAALNVDAIVDETYTAAPLTYDYAMTLAALGLTSTSDVKIVTNQMIFRIDGTIGQIGSNQGYDWYESRVANPDTAVAGLARVLHVDASKTKMYFRNVAKSETPDIILESACATALPTCSASISPQFIDMLTTSAPTPAPTAPPTVADVSDARMMMPFVSFLVAAYSLFA